MQKLKKYMIPLAALAAGLLIGSGIGYMNLNKEQRIFQDKMREANKKIAYIQKRMAEEKNEETALLEQRCREDVEKLQKALRYEKKTLGDQVKKFTEQVQKMETQVRDTEEVSAKTKKELQDMTRTNKDLDHDLKRVTTEKQTLQAELKKTSKELGQCSTNNADLIIIAEELVAKYRNKGLGSILMEKEPITQVKKVELEQFTQQYREEIEQLKIKKKDARGKNVTE
jgi:chromosome segregation ATPase